MTGSVVGLETAASVITFGTLFLVGFLVWCWWTSPTYKQQRALLRQARRDRRFARQHRAGR